jgi:hypothetical protein
LVVVVEVVERKSGYGGGDEWPREREEKRERGKNCFVIFFVKFVKNDWC